MGVCNSKMDAGEAEQKLRAEQQSRLRQLIEAGRKLDTFSAFARLSTNEEKVAHIYDTFTKDDFVLFHKANAATVKSSKKSTELLGMGDTAFSSRPPNLEVALTCYTNALTEAPLPTQKKSCATEMALGFGKRSAVLFVRQQYEECLRDVERALTLHDPSDKARVKLWRRGAECLHIMGNLEEAKRYYENGTETVRFESLPDMEKAEIVHHAEMYLKIAMGQSRPEVYRPRRDMMPPPLADGHNAKVLALSSCVEMVESFKLGRQIRATRDIHPGEVLSVGKPYVLTPTPDFHHCNGCAKEYDALVPCKACVLMTYCSEDCRDESWRRYHELECPVMQALMNYIGPDMARALRIFATVLTRSRSLQGLYNYVQHLEANTASDGRIRGFNDEGKYLCTDYATLHYLQDHADRLQTHTLYEFAAKAAVMVASLERHGNAVLRRELGDVKMRKFVGGLLMRYLLSGRMNANFLFGYSAKLGRSVALGGAMFTVSSMFNHACDPNTTEVFYGSNAVATACRMIPKGAQVTVKYLDDSEGTLHTTESRRATLQRDYFFTCECHLCTHAWPADHGEKLAYRTCLKCHATLPPAGDLQDVKCPRCGELNKAVDLMLSEAIMVKKLQEMLKLALAGVDMRAIMYRAIAETDRLETPQKFHVNVFRKVLIVSMWVQAARESS